MTKVKNITSLVGRIAQEPYRIFFPLAVLWGIVGVSHWFLYASHWIDHYSGYMHSSIQMQAYMGCFVLGFLLTAMPRFVAAHPASKTEVLVFLILMIILPLAYFEQKWLLGKLCFVSWILLLLDFARRRVKHKHSEHIQPPVELVWIPVAVICALLGAGMVAAAEIAKLPPWVLRSGKPLMDQGFILSIVVGVGGFLGPRLMGVHQLIKTSEIKIPDRARRERRQKGAAYLNAGFFLIISFFLEGMGQFRSAYILRAVVVTAVLFSTRALTLKPKIRDPFVQLLCVSFWMVVIGHWALAMVPQHRLIFLHVIFLGGYSLMTFSVGTMVILSHAGEASRLRRPLWILKVVAFGIASALSFRISSVFIPERYFMLLGVSSLLWLIAAFTWLGYSLNFVFRFPPIEIVEKDHEAAKKRVMECRDDSKTCGD